MSDWLFVSIGDIIEVVRAYQCNGADVSKMKGWRGRRGEEMEVERARAWGGRGERGW